MHTAKIRRSSNMLLRTDPMLMRTDRGLELLAGNWKAQRLWGLGSVVCHQSRVRIEDHW